MVAVNSVELTNVVAGVVPPKLITEVATKFIPVTVNVKKFALPAGALVGEIAVIMGEGVAGVEAEGVTDVAGFAHPFGRNSRPSERANTILENQRCFDFMAKPSIKLQLIAYARMNTIMPNPAASLLALCSLCATGRIGIVLRIIQLSRTHGKW
jgi:hypothetical protein